MAALPILLLSIALLFGGAVLAHLIGAASVLSFFAADRARFLAAAPQRIIAHIDLFSIMSMPLFILRETRSGSGTIPPASSKFRSSVLPQGPTWS